MENESAIILPVAEVEPLVGFWRQQYDPAARLGVPPHITLLYPFRAPEAAALEIPALREFFSGIQPFVFSLTGVRRFPDTVYLYPDQAERFTQIINGIVQRWPDCLPYRGTFADIVPHLTVAAKAEAQVLDTVEKSLVGGLPVRCIASQAQLLFSNAAGTWVRHASFPFAATS